MVFFNFFYFFVNVSAYTFNSDSLLLLWKLPLTGSELLTGLGSDLNCYLLVCMTRNILMNYSDYVGSLSTPPPISPIDVFKMA